MHDGLQRGVVEGCIRTVEDVVFEIQYMYVAYSNVLIEVENTDIAREPKSIPGGFRRLNLICSPKSQPYGMSTVN